MSEKLRQLPGAQKKAIVALACIVEAQGKGGHFKSIDPEVDTIIEECFDDDWAGNWDDEYRHLYLAGAVLLDKDQCIETVSALDMETKQAFKNLLLDIVGDDAMTVLAAAYVLKGIGMPSTPIPSAPTPRKNDKNTQEEDGTYVVEDSYFARLSDVNAVRSDDVKVFTIVDEDDDTQVKVGCGFNACRRESARPTESSATYETTGPLTPLKVSSAISSVRITWSSPSWNGALKESTSGSIVARSSTTRCFLMTRAENDARHSVR